MCKEITLGRKIDDYGRTINDPKTRGLCIICNKNKQRVKKGKGKNGSDYYWSNCIVCENTRRGYVSPKNLFKRDSYRVHKKGLCECCGFIPEHPCQLDVDHIDNNHNNNEESNLQTLCANCHRLKTWKHKNSKVLERTEFVIEYLKNEKQLKNLGNIVRYQPSLNGVRYSIYLKEGLSRKEIIDSLKKEIEKGTEIYHSKKSMEKALKLKS